MTVIAREVGVPRVEVESLVSFYSFLSTEPSGEVVIRLSDDVVDRMFGYERIAKAFEEALGVRVGDTTPDGRFTLARTACIGMCDQAPAALVEDVVVPDLSTDRVRQIVGELREHGDPRRLVHRVGDGNNAHPLIRSMVHNNIRGDGQLLLSPEDPPIALQSAVSLSPAEVIRAVKAARLRGRGGAGFPTGMKWEFARVAEGERKFVVCNADEGEPGTFKDRVLLTEHADRVLAGMTIAGYAIGADRGILYLRAEYAYLRPFLEATIEKRRDAGLLGDDIFGKPGFHFDIRIQMGAGAYVCGEETALISSCEGRRGDVKTRPPFPAQRGFRGFPTVVNNVETLCCVTKILHEGPATFCSFGTTQSSGTKLLCVSGDCLQPGIYELPFGVTLREVLDRADAQDAAAVLVGGPSGTFVGPAELDRKICFDDLSTGGAILVFGPHRDLLEVVHGYLEFFEDESCGYCTPCRVGTVLLRHALERVREGRGEPADLEQIRQIADTMKTTSRCGLGQTAYRPLTTTMERFPALYEDRVEEHPEAFRRGFDLDRARRGARELREAATVDEEGGQV
jgi:[NiFe] hydrogenase diaphorase moiety large subunit